MSRINPNDYKWRTGRKNNRIIYVQISGLPDDRDPMIGVMDTIEVAREVVASHNAILEKKII